MKVGSDAETQSLVRTFESRTSPRWPFGGLCFELALKSHFFCPFAKLVMRAALQFLTAGIVLFAGVDGLLGSDRGTEIILAVKKRPTYFVSYVTEKVWLQRMQGSGVTVEPLAFFDGDQTLVLQHVGNPVTKDTLPGDWEVQLLHILEVFLERNCRHNDLKPEEIMVDGTGRLRIVDLGFASEAFGGAPLTSLYPRRWSKTSEAGTAAPRTVPWMASATPAPSAE